MSFVSLGDGGVQSGDTADDHLLLPRGFVGVSGLTCSLYHPRGDDTKCST